MMVVRMLRGSLLAVGVALVLAGSEREGESYADKYGLTQVSSSSSSSSSSSTVVRVIVMPQIPHAALLLLLLLLLLPPLLLLLQVASPYHHWKYPLGLTIIIATGTSRQ